ncbi:hypothetical protein DUF2922 [Gottschalkia acidurici 9a]|uniref:DUF2922 domain-containing protein n=1 Tax=Gottschalkia acidurici (strain ATCC 7906 / DSM 604 / BCRC 14475 / CIP 104303 / KCTC 5404 / NCIMB 10678 / 9a) TaxID=1128398 RepID=K0AVK2_GOTA9|nr:DUF2922 domain-containing protein [Gottschalkia acidurici]AFS77309.1 hypothetical protein DUF2922 [Gottschalkia acidurici 9a]
MKTEKLQLIFKNESNSNVTLTVEDPSNELTELEVKAAMEDIVSEDVFRTKTGNIVSISRAKIVTTETRELEVQ